MASPITKLFSAHNEVVIRQELDWRGDFFSQLLQRLSHRPIIGLREKDRVRPPALQMPLQRDCKVLRVLQLMIIDFPTATSKVGREMPHRRIDEHKFLFVIAKPVPTRLGFDH